MKKQLSLISRSAIVALAAGAFCCAQSASAESNATASPAATATPALTALQPSGQKPRQPKKDGDAAAATASPSAMGGNNGRASGPATAGTLDRRDRDFMMTAAKGGMMEVRMGQMGQQMGQSAEVKKLGAQMVADHTKVNNELMALAQTKGVKLDTRHSMDKISGADFDQKWLTMMVADHQKNIAAFQTEANGGMDPQLKSFAGKTLPTLKKHLELVKAAQGKTMKKS